MSRRHLPSGAQAVSWGIGCLAQSSKSWRWLAVVLPQEAASFVGTYYTILVQPKDSATIRFLADHAPWTPILDPLEPIESLRASVSIEREIARVDPGQR